MLGTLIVLIILAGVCVYAYSLAGPMGLVIVIAIVIYLVWLGSREDDDSELIKLIEAMDGGDENARKKLAEKRLGDEKIGELREKIYLPKAEAGERKAQSWMALVCMYIKKDPKQAKMWYEKAAVQGDVEAMKSLALGYSECWNDPEDGAGIKGFGYDPQMEMYWYEKAAKLGDGPAQCSLAQLHNVGANMDQAFYWYTQAAQSTDCATRMVAYAGLAGIHGYMISEKYYAPDKEEMYLIRVLRTMQDNMHHTITFHESTYTMAAYSLGCFYRKKHMQSQNRTYLVRAAYCYVLAYQTGNQYGLTELQDLPYNPTELEWEEWGDDAEGFLYHPPC